MTRADTRTTRLPAAVGRHVHLSIRRGRGARGLRVGLVALVVLSSCQAPQPAEPQGGRGGAPGGVQFTDVGGYAEFVARLKDREQRSKTGSRDTESSETIFEESLQLETDGFVYHPNLMEFSLAALVGLTQQDYEETTDDLTRRNRDDGTLFGFDFEGNFFQKKPYPGQVYARRTQRLQPRLFRSSLETITTSYGLRWAYQDETMPTRLLFNHVDVELNPLDDEEPGGTNENTSFQFDTAYHFSEYNKLTFVYKHDELAEEPRGLRYDSDEFGLSHLLGFGSQKQHRLLSDVTYLDQRGTYGIERFEWRESLRLEHTDDLRTWYDWRLLDREQGGLNIDTPVREESYFLSGTLEHELYESLITQLHLYYQNQQFGQDEAEVEIERFGGFGSLDYRKTNPWGVLAARYRFGFDAQDRKAGVLRVEIINERHTFRDPDRIVLNAVNVITSTIVVRAEDTLTLYEAGTDYRVFVVGDRTEIERVPSGRISDGETVLIDYEFQLAGGLKLDTLTQNFEIRQDFPFGLTPYYRLLWQDQTLTPPDSPGAVPEDITSHTIGVRFQRGSLQLGAEYEDRYSTVSPYEAYRLRGSYQHRFRSNITAGVGARYTFKSYGPPNVRDTDLLSLEGTYRQAIRPNLTFEGTVIYTTGTDSIGSDNEGIDIDLAIEWLVRKTELRLLVEFGQREDDFAKNEFARVYFQARRNF